MNRYELSAKKRAQQLRAGEQLSNKETARILSDAAQEIRRLERELRLAADFKRDAEQLRSWIDGFRTAERLQRP